MNAIYGICKTAISHFQTSIYLTVALRALITWSLVKPILWIITTPSSLMVTYRRFESLDSLVPCETHTLDHDHPFLIDGYLPSLWEPWLLGPSLVKPILWIMTTPSSLMVTYCRFESLDCLVPCETHTLNHDHPFLIDGYLPSLWEPWLLGPLWNPYSGSWPPLPHWWLLTVALRALIAWSLVKPILWIMTTPSSLMVTYCRFESLDCLVPCETHTLDHDHPFLIDGYLPSLWEPWLLGPLWNPYSGSWPPLRFLIDGYLPSLWEPWLLGPLWNPYSGSWPPLPHWWLLTVALRALIAWSLVKPILWIMTTPSSLMVTYRCFESLDCLVPCETHTLDHDHPFLIDGYLPSLWEPWLFGPLWNPYSGSWPPLPHWWLLTIALRALIAWSLVKPILWIMTTPSSLMVTYRRFESLDCLVPCETHTLDHDHPFLIDGYLLLLWELWLLGPLWNPYSGS